MIDDDPIWRASNRVRAGSIKEREMNFGRKYVNVPSPQTKEKMMAKKYKVTRTFTDKAGKTWQEGQDYSGDETEARNQANQGNLEESSESGKPQPK